MPEPADISRREAPPSQPPHPVLRPYYANAGQRQTRVNAMFDAAAKDYDAIERAMSLGAGRWYRRSALERAGFAEGMRVLDVGCGTGVIAAQAAEITGGTVVALDPSLGMLREAQGRRIAVAVRGVGESLPFANGSFDRLSMGYALRHVADLNRAFSEYRRVLKPGGVALLLEITAPESRAGYCALKLYLKHIIPTFARVSRRGAATPLMSYYWETIEQCASPSTITQALRRAGFARVERRVEFGVFSAYTGVKTGA